MSYTLITHFDEQSYRKLYSVLECLKNETLCRVPFGRVNDDLRMQVDTLPYHFTISSSKDPQTDVLQKLSEFHLTPFEIKVNGLGIMYGRQNSYVLYFSLERNDSMDQLRYQVYERMGNALYLPQNHENHMTLCIDQDYQKILRIKKNLEQDFQSFTLKITGLGLYSIWPGKLVSLYSYDYSASVLYTVGKS